MIDFVRSVRLWFVPAEVRREGGHPDYRFSLANERTFLAWLRTRSRADRRWVRRGPVPARPCAGAGGSGSRSRCSPPVCCARCTLRAVNHWARCERAMRRGEDLPVSAFPALLSLVVAVVALVMVVVVLAGWEG